MLMLFTADTLPPNSTTGPTHDPCTHEHHVGKHIQDGAPPASSDPAELLRDPLVNHDGAVTGHGFCTSEGNPCTLTSADALIPDRTFFLYFFSFALAQGWWSTGKYAGWSPRRRQT